MHRVVSPDLFQHVIYGQLNGVYVYDIEAGNNVYISPRYTEITGYRLEDLHALAPEAFMELFHPDDREAVLAHMGAVTSSSVGAVFRLEYRFRHKDGDWVWLYGQDVPVAWDDDGRVTRFVGSFVDISEQKAIQAELEQFTRFAAHDLREPARRVEMISQFIAEGIEQGDQPEDILREVQRVRSEAQRLIRLVDDLRILAHVGVPTTEEETEVDLVALARAAVAAHGPGLSARYGEHPTVSGHPTLLATLYEALVSNVVAHAGPEREIHFTAESVDGGWVFGVRNTGSSVPEARLGRIFDPFRRFARASESGLGLTVCRRVVHHHGGRIWAESGEDWTHIKFSLGTA